MKEDEGRRAYLMSKEDDCYGCLAGVGLRSLENSRNRPSPSFVKRNSVAPQRPSTVLACEINELMLSDRDNPENVSDRAPI